ncbi:EamA family transporter [Anaerobacillus alkalilacustris]|uniref:EamA family transporter n=1 Tax=Anaerobacillus alkalilacustris TaxID=393763 RepID=A0A1S2LM59_9BACI|nr:DMT family transporter [Anaerobacillus alkalilacustris]OIJ13609.1 EamA family transporter [Anaerobacillus alkalilacustris]
MNKILKQSPILLLILATMIWGGNFVIGRAIVDELPPLTLAFWRWVVAAFVFIPFVWKEIVDKKEILLENLKFLFLMALTGVAGFNTLLYVGLHYTTSINASLVNTTAPLMIATLSYFLLKEKLKKNQLLGIILSFTGVMVIFSQGSLEVLLTLSFNIGDVIVIIAVILWALYSITIKYHSNRLPPLSSFAVSLVIGIFILFPFFLWENVIVTKETVWNIKSFGTISYVGLLASIVAFLAWNSAVSQIGPGKAGIFLPLIPVFTTVFAIIFLGEVLVWFQVLGGFMAVLGIYLATRTRESQQKKRGYLKSGTAN